MVNYIGKRERKRIIQFETDNFWNTDIMGGWMLFHKVNEENSSGNMVYCSNGFHPDRLVLVYYRGSGFKQTMHLRRNRTETHYG